MAIPESAKVRLLGKAVFEAAPWRWDNWEAADRWVEGACSNDTDARVLEWFLCRDRDFRKRYWNYVMETLTIYNRTALLYLTPEQRTDALYGAMPIVGTLAPSMG